MAKTMKATIQRMESFLSALGYLDTVSVGEPKEAPQGVHGSIFLAPYTHIGTTLNGTIERRAVTIRIYLNALAEPREDIEFNMDAIISELQEDLLGDFDLGGDIRNIDVTFMTVEFGYQDIGAQGGAVKYRIGDLLIPMIVDDSAVFVQ